jgi:hypothetical protein
MLGITIILRVFNLMDNEAKQLKNREGWGIHLLVITIAFLP